MNHENRNKKQGEGDASTQEEEDKNGVTKKRTRVLERCKNEDGLAGEVETMLAVPNTGTKLQQNPEG